MRGMKSEELKVKSEEFWFVLLCNTFIQIVAEGDPENSND